MDRYNGLSISLILDSSVGLWVGIQSAGELCLRLPSFESCIQQSNTTCLLSNRKSLACARASKITTGLSISLFYSIYTNKGAGSIVCTAYIIPWRIHPYFHWPVLLYRIWMYLARPYQNIYWLNEMNNKYNFFAIYSVLWNSSDVHMKLYPADFRITIMHNEYRVCLSLLYIAIHDIFFSPPYFNIRRPMTKRCAWTWSVCVSQMSLYLLPNVNRDWTHSSILD